MPRQHQTEMSFRKCANTELVAAYAEAAILAAQHETTEAHVAAAKAASKVIAVASTQAVREYYVRREKFHRGKAKSEAERLESMKAFGTKKPRSEYEQRRKGAAAEYAAGMATKQVRGFASLSAEKRREIASLGGKAALRRHKYTSEEASVAGLKGGTTTGRDSEHMRKIGRRGGKNKQRPNV